MFNKINCSISFTFKNSFDIFEGMNNILTTGPVVFNLKIMSTGRAKSALIFQFEN